MIITYPNKILKEKTKPVIDFSDIPKIVKEMEYSMYKENGVGLAAPQINLGLSIFISGIEKTKVFVNPTIECYGPIVLKSEGCLSFPGVQLNIKRYAKTRIKAQDVNGEFFEMDTYGLLAHVIQHEYDHLQGKLMIDYLPFFKRKKFK